MVIHFPIAFLSAAAILHAGIICIWRNIALRSYLLVIRDFALLIGTISGWMAVLTGEWAEDVVNRVICDPTVTNHHEELALLGIYFFSAASVMILFKRVLFSLSQTFLASIFMGALIFTGSFFLVQAAHLGAQLVFQQGAGTYSPSPECKEFE